MRFEVSIGQAEVLASIGEGENRPPAPPEGLSGVIYLSVVESGTITKRKTSPFLKVSATSPYPILLRSPLQTQLIFLEL